MKYKNIKNNKTVKAFQFGVDEIPIWFIEMMNDGDYEIWKTKNNNIMKILWNDNVTGHSYEAADKFNYVIKDTKHHIITCNPSYFAENYKRKYSLYEKIKRAILRETKS